MTSVSPSSAELSGPPVRRPRRWLSWRPDAAWWAEIGRFLIVGGVAFVVDLGLFNLLAYVHVFGYSPALATKPVTAKIIAALVATLVSWLGNRHWTFSSRRSNRPVRELAVYGAINLVALLIPPAVLYVTLYWVGAHGPVAANAASVVGIGIGTVFRYIGYKMWAFPSTGAADS